MKLILYLLIIIRNKKKLKKKSVIGLYISYFSTYAAFPYYYPFFDKICYDHFIASLTAIQLQYISCYICVGKKWLYKEKLLFKIGIWGTFLQKKSRELA